jgi:hypothetical protein
MEVMHERRRGLDIHRKLSVAWGSTFWQQLPKAKDQLTELD